MKSLKLYFVVTLVWASAGLFLVSCSDKKSNGQACVGTTINGQCQGGNWGNSQYPPQSYYSPNGSIQNSSQFKDLFVRYYNREYYFGYLGSGNNSAQVKIAGYNNQIASIYIITPEIPSGSAVFQAEKFQYTGGKTIFQIFYNNPHRYVIAELVLNGDLTKDNNVTYVLNYKRNANSLDDRVIINGSGGLKRNIDFY